MPQLHGDGWLVSGCPGGNFMNSAGLHPGRARSGDDHGRIAAETIIAIHARRERFTEQALSDYKRRLEETYIK